MTAYESFEIAAKEIEARYGKEKSMKQYLIGEDRVKSLLKTNQWSDDKDALMNLPEAQFLDLSKVERWIVTTAAGEFLGMDKYPDGPYVRYSDLTAIVQPKPIRELDGSLTYPHERPDVSALVEALERILKHPHVEQSDWLTNAITDSIAALRQLEGEGQTVSRYSMEQIANAIRARTPFGPDGLAPGTTRIDHLIDAFYDLLETAPQPASPSMESVLIKWLNDPMNQAIMGRATAELLTARLKGEENE